MKESIKQATRAATAMEKFAEAATVASKAAAESVVTVKDSMSRQLRAYLCVNFATAGFQNTETKFRFEVRLNLLNAGFTPGYKVSYRARVFHLGKLERIAFPGQDGPNHGHTGVAGDVAQDSMDLDVHFG
jgi:hypothetical protein